MPALCCYSEKAVIPLRKKRNEKKSWKRRAFLLLSALFLFSGGALLRDLSRSHHERAANQALARQVHKGGAERPDAGDGEAVTPEEARREQYRLLREQNGDFAGWLSIEGTKGDYPVMFTPEEPEYYLRRAFDGSYAASGSLFIGEGCELSGNHIIIYGHHMRDGSMFGSLPDYADQDYGREHPVIRFETPEESGVYEVLAAFYSRVYRVGETDVFRYYQYADLSEAERFSEYVEQVRAAALYDTGVTAEYGDRLLTLSTCSYHTENGRFVVVAVRKAAGTAGGTRAAG